MWHKYTGRGALATAPLNMRTVGEPYAYGALSLKLNHSLHGAQWGTKQCHSCSRAGSKREKAQQILSGVSDVSYLLTALRSARLRGERPESKQNKGMKLAAKPQTTRASHVTSATLEHCYFSGCSCCRHCLIIVSSLAEANTLILLNVFVRLLHKTGLYMEMHCKSSFSLVMKL